MNKTIRVKGPDNSKMLGNHYIIPLDSFSAKGHKWMRQLVFQQERVAAKINDKIYVCAYWSKPTLKTVDCGFVGSLALDGSGWKDCMCDECLEGRKEVANGWTPDKED